MDKSVRPIMNEGLITCNENNNIVEVSEIMSRNHIHSVLVIDSDRKPVGIISDFDLLAGEWLSTDKENLKIMREIRAKTLMTKSLHTIDIDTMFTDVARIMVKNKIHRMVVMEKDRAVGIISTSDLIVKIAEHSPAHRKNISGIMTHAILICQRNTTITQVARILIGARRRFILVSDLKGKFIGVVSSFDLIEFCQPEKIADVPVSEIIRPPLTIDISDSLTNAAELMIRHHRHRLIVTDSNNHSVLPVGIISTYDILEEMAMPASDWKK